MIHVGGGISYRSGPGWHVVQTAPQGEQRAREGIRALGFDVFAPTERVIVVRRGRKIEADRPYIRGYLFVAFDTCIDDWHGIVDVDGVVDLLRNNDIPSRVPTAWVEALRYAEKVGELDRTKIDPDGFKVGETVRVAEGPFAGHQALIQEFMAKMKSTTARKRAKVLLNLLGRMTTLDLPVTGLEKL